MNESKEGCKVEDCRGKLVEAEDRCLAHTSPEFRQARLKELHNGGTLNARGVPIDAELLKEILNAAPRDEEGRPHLQHANFEDACFNGWADFRGVRFSDEANFERVRFSDRADFEGARFSDAAVFINVEFSESAGFIEVQFNGAYGLFASAWFGGTADFTYAQFNGEAIFRSADFSGYASFSNVRFSGEADFGNVRFNDKADFKNARFNEKALLGPLIVSGPLQLDGATFGRGGKIEVGTPQRISCKGLRSADGAANLLFRVRWAQVDFSEADFSRPTIVSPLPFAAFKPQWFPELPDWASPDDRLSRPRVISLRWANVAELVLTDVDLSACQFVGAHNLDQLRLEGDTTFTQPPQGWGRTRIGRWWWTRDTLAEEQQWRAGKGYAKRAGWCSKKTDTAGLDDDEPLEPRRIASLYRDLRKAREDAKDEPGAAAFYCGEMEMRRLDPTKRGPEHWTLFLYWLTSGYGLRAWRALASLGALWLLVSAAFVWMGFAATHSFRTAAVYTARTVIGLLRDPQPPLTLTGDVLQIAWRLVAPVLLGLAVLSIRGRVKR